MLPREEKTPSGKVFYKIGEVSHLTGLEPYVLRYWESEFPALHPRKNRGGQRVYVERDIQTILRIKKMLYQEGYTIAGAKRRLMERQPRKGDRAKKGSPDLIHRIKEELEDILHSLGPSEKERGTREDPALPV